MTGLIYEVLWTRILTLSFGHTVWAITTVLAVFMGGLALGSLVFGKIADRVREPPRLYALLETGIGLYCIAAPYLLGISGRIHLSAVQSTDGSLVSKIGIQFLLSGLVLIVPTFLMGGTVPAMSRVIIRRSSEGGRVFGALYGINTFGAAVGAFAAGYWLLPSIGVTATNLLAAGINLAIGAVILLSKKGPLERDSGAPPVGVAEVAADPAIPFPGRILGPAFFLTGAAAMIFQVAWVRALILVVGNSTHAYSAILVTFLLGIALGSILFARFRFSGPLPAGYLLSGVSISVFLLLPFFDSLPDLFMLLFKRHTEGYAYIQIMQFLIVSSVVLVPTTLMGMTLPCLTAMVLRDGKRIGADVGNYYAINTVGAILGSILGGFILVPRLGSQSAIACGIAVELFLAAAFLGAARPEWRKPIYPAAALAGAAIFLFPAWNKGVMNMAVSVYPLIPSAGQAEDYHTRSRKRAGELLYSKEGISSAVAVFRNAAGERWFTVNGKNDGGTGDLIPQARLAIFPMLFRPNARRVAIVGLGTGVTAGTAGMFGGVEAIDVVELEPAILEVARYFNTENGGILRDPRARIHIDDGRSFLDARHGAYDVIVSEPSNPWIAGVSNLYTADFFRQARESLSSEGVFGIWVQGYSLSPEAYKLIVRTFLSVFPDASLWQVGPADTILIGRKGGAAIDVAAINARLRGSPKLLSAFGIDGDIPLEPLFRSYLLGPSEMRSFAGDGPLNTDDRNLLEFEAPRHLYSQNLNRILWEITRSKDTSSPPFLPAPEAETASFRLAAGERFLFEENPALAIWQFARLPATAPGFPENRSGPVRLASGGIREDFDGAPVLPFIPSVGYDRPDSDDRNAVLCWLAVQGHLTRTSGIEPGAGRGGSPGLVLHSSRSSPLGFQVPLETEPGREYEVLWWMRSDFTGEGEAGVTLAEFDTREDDGGQPRSSFNRRHLVKLSNLGTVKGSRGWTACRARFTTTAKTGLVRFYFYLDGKRGDRAGFDEIVIRRAG